MNRRDFLKFLLATPAATFVDYEKLLWIPGEKTIFLPPAVTHMQLLEMFYGSSFRYINHLFSENDNILWNALKADKEQIEFVNKIKRNVR